MLGLGELEEEPVEVELASPPLTAAKALASAVATASLTAVAVASEVADASPPVQ